MNTKRLFTIIFVISLGVVVWAIYRNHSAKSENNINNDYEIIEELHIEMEKISNASSVNSIGDNGAWHIYELGLMYQKTATFLNSSAAISETISNASFLTAIHFL